MKRICCFLILTYILLAQCRVNGDVFETRIAVIAHGPDNLPMVSNDFDPAFQFTGPGSGKLYYQSLTFYQYLLTKFGTSGGIPVQTKNGTAHVVRPQFVYFNIGSLLQPTSTLSKMTTLSNELDQGLYGKFDFILSPAFTIDAITLMVSSICEKSKKCIALATVNTAASLFKCQPSPISLPSDCVAANKKVNSRRFDQTLSVMYDGAQVLASHVGYFYARGARSAVVIAGGLSFGVNSGTETINTLKSSRIQILGSYFWDVSIPLTNTTGYQFAQTIVQLNPDVVFFAFGSSDVAAVASFDIVWKFWKNQFNWLPKAVSFGGAGHIGLVPSAPANYWYTYISTPWTSKLKGLYYRSVNSTDNFELFSATEQMDSPAVFASSFKKYWKTDLSDIDLVYPAVGIHACIIIQKLYEYSMSTTNSIEIDNLLFASSRISVPTVYGRMQFDPWGRTMDVEQSIVQMFPDMSQQLITPLNVGIEAIYPMPTWNERIPTTCSYCTSTEQAMLAITCVSMVFVMILMVVVFVNRKHSVIKASSPLFCIVILLGCQFILLSNIVYPFLNITSSQCMASIWLLTTGFSFMYGSLFIKTYRIAKIFNQDKLQIVKLTNFQLIKAIAVLLCFDMLLNLLWNVIAPVESTLTMPDQYRPSTQYYSCSYSTNANIFIYIHLVTKGLMLLTGCVQAYKTRNAPSKFNEAMYILLAIYNFLVLLTLIIPLFVSGIGGREVKYVIQQIGVNLIILSTCSILFVPKILNIVRDGTDVAKYVTDDQATELEISTKPKTTTFAPEGGADSKNRTPPTVPSKLIPVD